MSPVITTSMMESTRGAGKLVKAEQKTTTAFNHSMIQVASQKEFRKLIIFIIDSLIKLEISEF